MHLAVKVYYRWLRITIILSKPNFSSSFTLPHVRAEFQGKCSKKSLIVLVVHTIVLTIPIIFFTSWQLEYFCCEVPERVHFFIVLFLLSIQCSTIYCLVLKLYHIKIKYLNDGSLIWAFYARFQNLIPGIFSSCESTRKNIIFAILLSVTSHYCRWSCIFIAMKDSHREKLQEQLTKLIMKVLVSNPQLHYYQVSGLSKILYLFNRSKGHDSGWLHNSPQRNVLISLPCLLLKTCTDQQWNGYRDSVRI